jgi:hypothetical protein
MDAMILGDKDFGMSSCSHSTIKQEDPTKVLVFKQESIKPDKLDIVPLPFGNNTTLFPQSILWPASSSSGASSGSLA